MTIALRLKGSKSIKTSTVSAALLAFACLLPLAHNVRAQETSDPAFDGYTYIDFDPESDIVTGYSETDITDYDLETDYEAYVFLKITDGDFYSNTVASGAYRDYNDVGFASVTLQFYGDPATTYTAYGTHKAYALLYDDYWDYDYYPYRHVYDYWDDWYFTYFEGYDIFDPWDYFFFSPGYNPITRSSRYMNLGTTYDSASVTTPGAPDHLQILNDVTSITQPCDVLERDITYRVVDVNNHGSGNHYIRENDSSVVDTCDNTIPPYDDVCDIVNGTTFEDSLSAACPAFGDYDCGYDITDEQWLWCSYNGLVPLALMDYNIHHDRIIVSGYGDKLPKWWYVRADGSIRNR